MTTDSHPDPTSNRWHDQDVEGRADSDVTRAFWGDGAGWASQPADTAGQAEVAPPRGRIGATVGRWWGSTTSGRSGATRAHAPVTSSTAPDDDVTSVDDHDDPEANWDDAWETAPPEPPRSGVDPLLARLGGLAVVLTLLVPVVMGFTSDDGDAVRTSSVAPDVSPAPSGGQPAEQSVATSSAPTTPVPGPTSPDTDVAVAAQPTTPVIETPITSPEAEALAVDECARENQVVFGDFWIRIADGSGAPLADLLAVNGATVSTPLYPGRSICLPDGATIPPPPPAAVAPTSTDRSSTRNSSTSSKASTTPVSGTPVNSTPSSATPAPPPPASTATPAEVEAIIRAVWPDELEDRALEIAWRESKYNPIAKNSCCSGVFQIYWSVHRSWLGGLGITSADQLYDPATNARAALALYERSGGWGPWGG